MAGGGAPDALTQLYQAASGEDGYALRHVTDSTMVADFQPPYFPPPYTVPQPPSGASSTVLDFAACPPPSTARHFSGGSNMYGYIPAVQPAPPRPGGLPSSSAVHPADFVAASVGGGAVYGVASPRRATGGGGEFSMNCGTASAAVAGLHEAVQVTSTLPEFNFENLTFTPARIINS